MGKTDKLSKKGEETRTRILESALNSFLKLGFEETTLRKLAELNGMSLGSFYYYFADKDQIVLELYRESLGQMRPHSERVCESTKVFEKRFDAILRYRIESMKTLRPIWRALAKSSADPTSPLSPFSKETADIRESMIRIFSEMLSGSNLKTSAKIVPHLPKILWLIMMGVILFWIYDESKSQERTDRLISIVSKNTTRLLKALRIPIVGEQLLPFKEILSLFADDHSTSKVSPEKRGAI